MNAYELCQRNVVTVRSHEDVANAAWILRERHVACLVVVEPMGPDGGWRPVGLIADRDIVRNVVARELDARHVLVADAMTRCVPVRATSPIAELMQRMQRGGERRMPVVDERGRLVGIITLDDIYEHLIWRDHARAEHLIA